MMKYQMSKLSQQITTIIAKENQTVDTAIIMKIVF